MVRKSYPESSVISLRKQRISRLKRVNGQIDSRRKAFYVKAVKSTGQPDEIFINPIPKARLQVYVFGEGGSGELGLGSDNSAIEVMTPKLNSNLTGVVGISTGGMHAVALTSNNQIITWGVNDNFALGRNTTYDVTERTAKIENSGLDSGSESDIGLNPFESTPTAIDAHMFPKGTDFVQVAAGDSATFALTSTGKVYGWGTFRDSQGNNSFTLDSKGKVLQVAKEPLLLPGLERVVQLGVGADFALALDVNGLVYSWGVGQQDELGRRLGGRLSDHSLLPRRVALRKNPRIVSIHTGFNHAFAIDINGDTWAWGLNNFGQTGIKAGAGRTGCTIKIPQKVPDLMGLKMKALAGGNHHSLGITEAGECLVWGRIDGGRLGIDAKQIPMDDIRKVVVDERGQPRILLEPAKLHIANSISVAAGPEHSILLTSDGKAFSWGFNGTYQCGQGNDDDILVAKLMDGKQIREQKLVWAGAGGQYSMLASPAGANRTINGVCKQR